jgi:hypothetical protein
LDLPRFNALLAREERIWIMVAGVGFLGHSLDHPVAELGHEFEVGGLITAGVIVNLVFKHLENVIGVAAKFDAALHVVDLVQVVLDLFAPVQLILRQRFVLVDVVEAQEL